jgi:hypothetical protein
MVPGEVIAGDVKIKLSGPCTGAESYTLGLRYKERVFWKLRREDASIPKKPKFRYNSVQDKDLWSMHEEERIAFEIKSPLVTDRLSRNFMTRFGVLVPNTNYPPGLDCRLGCTYGGGAGDMISSESIYEYFVEIRFSNGTTSEIPAGMTAFAPSYLPTENNTPSVNVSLSRAPTRSRLNMKPPLDRLQINYTIEVSFPEGTHVHQNSSVNFTAIVHRTGYTDQMDIFVELCAFLANGIEWHSQELQNRSQPFLPSMKALVPSVSPVPNLQFYQVVNFPNQHQCREIKFTATSAPSTHESPIFSTSSEPISLSLYANHDAVPDFSTYYQKLGHRVKLNLHVTPDPSELWDNELERIQWEKRIAVMGADELDWVPWMPPTQARRRSLSGNANSLSVIPMQKQEPVRSTPIHYLSDKARQPVFVHPSEIADLRLMLPEERDLIAPLTRPSIKVIDKGEEVPRRYFTSADVRYPIYVGDTWVRKVLPMAVEGQHEKDAVDHLLVVQ